MATIATHNGSKVCREHNVRNPKVTAKEKHIDLNGIHEVWYDEKIREAYKRIFGEAQAAYNVKQEREERKIKSYYNAVCKDSKKHPAYEMIVGVYGDDCSPKIGKEILKEFADTWKVRNKNLELIGVYYHADEQGDPHIHIDYIPVAHGYTRGLEIQNGLNKALEEMGFETVSKKQTAQMAWEKRENLYLERLCESRGIVVERPTEAEKKHLDTETYKAIQEVEKATMEAEKAKNATEKATESLESIQKELENVQEQLQQVRAEYEAKKEYVNTFDSEFLGTYEQVKENKKIFSKEPDSYVVPAEIWKTQRLWQADIAAHEAAKNVWDSMVNDYAETKKENQSLRKENNKLREIINRIEETLSDVSHDVREAFLELFEANQNKKDTGEKEASKMQNEER